MPAATRNRPAAAVSLAALLVGLVPFARAQEGIERTVLLRHDLDIPGREALMVEVSIPPGAREGRHTHAGLVLARVLEGELRFEMAGEPARRVGPGGATLIEAGRVHEGINDGPVPVRLLATFVVEKGEPLSTPAP